MPALRASAASLHARAAGVVALLVLGALAIAGCGGGDPEPAPAPPATTAAAGTTADATAPPPGDPAEIRIGLGDTTTLDEAIYLADQLGYFAEAGLDVSIEAGSSDEIADEVAAGNLDLGVTGGPWPALLAQDGEAVKVVYAANAADSDGALVGRDEVVNPNDGSPEVNYLQDGRLGTTSKSTPAAGYANHYNQKFFNSTMQVINYPTPRALLNALDRGDVDGAVGRIDLFEGSRLRDDLAVLVDPREDHGRMELLGPVQQPERLIWGIGPELERNREAVTGALAAINRAVAYTRANVPADFLPLLEDQPPFDEMTKRQAIRELKTNAYFIANPDGSIPFDYIWATSVDNLLFWNKKVDPASPDLAYDEIVDNSYVTEANAAASPGTVPVIPEVFH